jgi:hypothetical protein
MPQSERDRVLLAIARCPGGNPPLAPHPLCSTVVGAPVAANRAGFQVPEPWRGDIENAPLLFASSNPSLSLDDDCALNSSPMTVQVIQRILR